MKAPRAVPAKITRRPPEPFRPAPAAKVATSLLGTRVRRRRHRDAFRHG